MANEVSQSKQPPEKNGLPEKKHLPKKEVLNGHIKLPQDTETPLTTLSTAFGTALYLYARSGDSVTARTIGQDYVTFRYDASNLVFAVCDGVGQSFMGDLAARLLGDGLSRWLWELLQKPESAESFSEAVAEALNALTDEGKQAVTAYKLPDSLPGLIVQALEMQRKYGSESMFVAGRIALQNPDPWIALCWLGDSPVAAIDIDGELVDLGPKGHTSERWNASTGVKGQVHTWVSSAERVARVAGYTDGLGVESVPKDADLAKLMEGWMSSPPEDDASLFDVRLAPSPETTGPSDPEDLEDLQEITFTKDESRPITVESEPRTPVKDVQTIEATRPDTPAVEGWRPLDEKQAEPPSKQPAPQVPQTLPEAAEMLSTLSSQTLSMPTTPPPSLEAQQQIQMWQQAALLGLTSAALAMLMVERLIKDQADEEDEGADKT